MMKRVMEVEEGYINSQAYYDVENLFDGDRLNI
jgi:hypothetical protein